MDMPSWHAQRRAQKEYEMHNVPHRGPDGQWRRVEQDVLPMNESSIGGARDHAPSPSPPDLPPKDDIYTRPGYIVGQRPTNFFLPSNQLTHMTAVERSRTLRAARMNPHLQFMVGPLLRYDTVDDQGIWHGAALIVTADSGSVYEPHPMLKYEWDPDKPSHSKFYRGHRPAARSFDLGPHPADPYSTLLSKSTFVEKQPSETAPVGPNARTEQVPGQEIWVYGGSDGTFTFWRFTIQIPLGPHEMTVTYSINNGQQFNFFVPGRTQNMRWACYSCNGFSAGVNPDDFRGPGFKSGYDPVWMDLLAKHAEQPFHALVGGGDQIYCDGVMREPELQDWVSKMKPEEKKSCPLTKEIALAIDRFYFNHYCQSFRSGAFARANSSIPMMNMADDHDLIDGFGSYPDDMQMAPVFRTVGARGYFFFLLFQCFINDEHDGLDDQSVIHTNKSIIIGDSGRYVSSPSHSFLGYLGPQVYILLLDCRAERRKDQVCSPLEYQKVFHRLNQLPSQVEHVIVQLGIPIAYPRMVFLEAMLGSKFNPLVALGKTGSFGLAGFVNKFNSEAELLDDLNDHWTASGHKKERNWFIEQLQVFAKATRRRISFLSGDVHCAAVGVLRTFNKKAKEGISPSADHRYMVNVVTSAIVNTPPPEGVISLVSTLATKVHKTLHHIGTDETMLPIFQTEPNGTPRKQKYIMGRRNWCQVNVDEGTGDVVFDIRVEKEKGLGQTVGYPVRVPAPRWSGESQDH